jgi:hypothetical protein
MEVLKKMKMKKKSIPKRKKIRAAHWKRPATVSAEKYKSISGTILKILGPKGMRWGNLVGRVEKKLTKFEGPVWPYVTYCLRKLETQKKVMRKLGPPVLYSKRKV